MCQGVLSMKRHVHQRADEEVGCLLPSNNSNRKHGIRNKGRQISDEKDRSFDDQSSFECETDSLQGTQKHKHKRQVSFCVDDEQAKMITSSSYGHKEPLRGHSDYDTRGRYYITDKDKVEYLRPHNENTTITGIHHIRHDPTNMRQSSLGRYDTPMIRHSALGRYDTPVMRQSTIGRYESAFVDHSKQGRYDPHMVRQASHDAPMIGYQSTKGHYDSSKHLYMSTHPDNIQEHYDSRHHSSSTGNLTTAYVHSNERYKSSYLNQTPDINTNYRYKQGDFISKPIHKEDINSAYRSSIHQGSTLPSKLPSSINSLCGEFPQYGSVHTIQQYGSVHTIQQDNQKEPYAIQRNLSTRSPTEGVSDTKSATEDSQLLLNKPVVCRSPTEITGFPSNTPDGSTSLLYDQSLAVDYGSFSSKDFSCDNFQESFLKLVSSPTPSGASLSLSAVSTVPSTGSRVQGFTNKNYGHKYEWDIAGADWPYLVPQFDDLYSSDCDLSAHYKTIKRPSPEGAGGCVIDGLSPNDMTGGCDVIEGLATKYTADYYTLTYTDLDVNSDVSNTAENNSDITNTYDVTKTQNSSFKDKQAQNAVYSGRQTSVESNKSSDCDVYADTVALLPKHRPLKNSRNKMAVHKTDKSSCSVDKPEICSRGEGKQSHGTLLTKGEGKPSHGTLLTSMKCAIKFHNLEIKQEDILEAEKKNKLYASNLGEGIAEDNDDVCTEDHSLRKVGSDSGVEIIENDNQSTQRNETDNNSSHVTETTSSHLHNNNNNKDNLEVSTESDGYIYDEDIKPDYKKSPTNTEDVKYNTNFVYNSIINNKNRLLENLKSSSNILSHVADTFLGKKDKDADASNTGASGKTPVQSSVQRDAVKKDGGDSNSNKNIDGQKPVVVLIHGQSVEEKQDIEKGEKDVKMREKENSKSPDEAALPSTNGKDETECLLAEERLQENKAGSTSTMVSPNSSKAILPTDGSMDRLKTPTKSESSSTNHSKVKPVQKVVYYQNRFITVPVDPRTLKAGSLSREKLRSSSVSVELDDINTNKGGKLANFRKCKSLDRAEDTIVTMQQTGDQDNLTRTSSKADIVIHKIKDMLQDKRESCDEGTGKANEALAPIKGSPILKKILNMLFIAVGLVLLLGVLSAILYSSLGRLL